MNPDARDYGCRQRTGWSRRHIQITALSTAAPRSCCSSFSLTVLRAPAPQIASHIRVAPDLGLSATEILEVTEISLPEAGVVAFQHGFEVWKDVTGATGIEPTVSVHGGTAIDSRAD